ncbi:MAG: hypothetical protein AAGD14_02630 [Planctomycetota bacterium]
MLRVWLTSFVLVALVAGAILYFAQQKPTTVIDSSTPQVRRTLDEASVRKYIRIEPEIDRIMIRSMRSGTPPGKQTQQDVEALLHAHGMDRASWNRLRTQVDDVVNILRLEREAPKEKARVEEQLRMKRDARAEAQQADLQKQLDREIADLERKLAFELRPVHPQDRAVVESYWTDLNRIAARLRPQ